PAVAVGQVGQPAERCPAQDRVGVDPIGSKRPELALGGHGPGRRPASELAVVGFEGPPRLATDALRLRCARLRRSISAQGGIWSNGWWRVACGTRSHAVTVTGWVTVGHGHVTRDIAQDMLGVKGAQLVHGHHRVGRDTSCLELSEQLGPAIAGAALAL